MAETVFLPTCLCQRGLRGLGGLTLLQVSPESQPGPMGHLQCTGMF